MWKKSRNGVKIIVTLCFVFALAVSPCFARAPWAALFGIKEVTDFSAETSPEESSAEVLKESVNLSQEEFSQVLSTESSKTAGNPSYEELLRQLNVLEQEYTKSQTVMANVLNWYENLKIQLDSFAETEALSEAEYEEVIRVVDVLAGITDDNSEVISEQQKKIEEMRKKLGTRLYVKLGASAGFDGIGIADLGTGLTLGVKFDNGIMAELGASYDIGGMDFFMNPTFDLSSVKVGFALGYMF